MESAAANDGCESPLSIGGDGHHGTVYQTSSDGGGRATPPLDGRSAATGGSTAPVSAVEHSPWDSQQRAEGALEGKWRALRRRQQQQSTTTHGQPTAPSPEAIFTAPVPSASVQEEEAALRRSPPLLPLFATEPTMPWAEEEDRAGWGRPVKRTLPRPRYVSYSPVPAEPSARAAAWVDADLLLEGSERREREEEGLLSPEPVPSAMHSRSSSVRPLEEGGTVGDGDEEGSDFLSFSTRRETAGSHAAALRVPLPGPAVVPPPLECVAAQTVPLTFPSREGARASGPRSKAPRSFLERFRDHGGNRVDDWWAPGANRNEAAQQLPQHDQRRALARHMAFLPSLSPSATRSEVPHPTSPAPPPEGLSGHSYGSRRILRTEDVPESGYYDEDDDEEDEEDGMLEGDLRCDRYLCLCCACLPRIGWHSMCWQGGSEGGRYDSSRIDDVTGEGDAAERETLLPAFRGSPGAPPPPFTARAPARKRSGLAGGCHFLKRRLMKAWHFFNVFDASAACNEHLPTDARRYCLLHFAAALSMLTAVVVVGTVEVMHRRYEVIDDGTACQGYGFEDVLRPDLTSSLCCFAINALFEVWFALRAARYEKSGFLVAAGVVVALQVTRAVYFTVVVAPRYLEDRDSHRFALRHAMEFLVNAGVALSVLASLLSWRVRRAFGWRSFTQGITQPGTLALRRRYMRLQTCLQLDGVVTLNAYLAMLFLCDDWQQQAAAGLVTALVLLALTLLMPLLRVTRHWWPLVPCLVVLLLSLGYYTFMVSSNLSSFGFRDHDKQSPDVTSTSSEEIIDEDSSAWYTQSQMAAASHQKQRHSFLSVGQSSSAALHYSVKLTLDVGGVKGRCYRHHLLPCLAAKSIYIMTPNSLEVLFKQAAYHAMQEEGSRSAYAVPSLVDGAASSTALHDLLHDEPLRFEGNDGAQKTLEEARSPLQGVVPVNGSSTYLPTHGSRADEYFQLLGCNYTTCFTERAADFARYIHGCCQGYGRCSRKDNYRLYGVMLLVFLSLVAFTDRVTLAAVAWRRVVAQDDEALAAFQQAHRQVRRQQRHGDRGEHRRASPTWASTGPYGQGRLSPSPDVRRQLQYDRE